MCVFFNLVGERRNPRREGKRVLYPVRGLGRGGSFVRGRGRGLERKKREFEVGPRCQ